MPGLDLNEPINWDEIEEFEGGILDLNYNFVWHCQMKKVIIDVFSVPTCVSIEGRDWCKR